MTQQIKKPVIVIGAGGHARVLIDAIRLMKLKIVGATDARPNSVDHSKLNVKLLGTDNEILKYPPTKVLLVNGVGQVKVSPLRAEIFNRFKSKGYTFASVRHPSAVIASDVRLAEGVQIMAGAIIQTAAQIGKNTIINTGASVDHDCCIGSHVHIAPGAVLCGTVTVGEGSHIGAGTILVNSAAVAKYSFVKSGTLIK